MYNVEEIFEIMREGVRMGPIQIKELKEKGVPIVGTYCTFTPWELINAAGGAAVSLCSTSEKPIAAAERHLPRNLCPLIKSSYGFALTDTCPYFHFCDIAIGETTCDGKKKMYEYLNRIKPVHVMQLPQTLDDSAIFQWRESVLKMSTWLEEFYGIKITEDNLSKAIREGNAERKALNEFFALSKLDPAPVTGLEIMMVSDWTRLIYDPNEIVRRLHELTNAIRENYENGERRTAADRKRILVTGCPLGKAVEKTIVAIEENGGTVVCYDNCGHYKGTLEMVDETQDPLEAIADKYMHTACSVISPNDRRMNILSRFADEYQIDGVVDIVLQACHTYAIETMRVRETMNNKGNIPYISIETDYYQGDTEQLSTRMGAFMEMMS